MYVCNCKGLRESQVREAVGNGATMVARVFKACGTQPQCARCATRIAQVIRSERATLHQDPVATRS